MIILEGPDGSGKTTLLSNLLDQFPNIEEHARASASVGGPLEDIHIWAQIDLMTQLTQPLSFYDRHPMFSEPIYGSICRDFVHEWFSSDEARGLGESFIEKNLTVICLPPLETVIANLDVNDQMQGVEDNIATIYGTYQQLLVHLAEHFPLNIFHYDYTVDNDLNQLISVIEGHVARWNRKDRIA